MPAAKPVMSIVIPVYGQLHLVMGCLVSIAKTINQPVQIICVDDATPEFDLLDVPLPISCAVVRQKENQGFATSCNAGATHALADVILFLNSDTVAHDGWLSSLVTTFSDPMVGIAGPKLVFPEEFWCQTCRVYGPILCPQHPNDCQKVERIQSCGGWFDARKGPFHRYFMWRADDPVVNKPEAISWTTGAAMAIRKDVFVAAEGFDTGYQRAYFEDVDMCMRVRRAGMTVMYQPQSVFTHKVGQSTMSAASGDPLQAARRFQHNSRRFHTLWDKDIVVDTPGVVYVNY